jgi:transcription elongation factor Elf1
MDMELREMCKTESGCLEVLKRLKYGGAFQCRHCGGTESSGISTRERVIVCAFCKVQESLTAKTLFERVQKPLTKIFHILFDTASDAPSSGAKLAQDLEDISQSTIWRWQGRGRAVMEEFFTPLDQQSVHYSLLSKVLFKRSCESSPALNTVSDINDSTDTPGSANTPDTPEIIDIPEIEEMRQIPETPESSISEPAQDNSGTAHSASTTEKVFGAVSLRHLDMFQQRTVELNLENFQWPIDANLIREAILFIQEIFQGISRKYAQRYAAQFIFAKLYAGQFKALLTACIRAGPISDVEIAVYTSPEFITLPVDN